MSPRTRRTTSLEPRAAHPLPRTHEHRGGSIDADQPLGHPCRPGWRSRPVPHPSSSTGFADAPRQPLPERHVAPPHRLGVLPVVERRVGVPAFPALCGAASRRTGTDASGLRLTAQGLRPAAPKCVCTLGARRQARDSWCSGFGRWALGHAFCVLRFAHTPSASLRLLSHRREQHGVLDLHEPGAGRRRFLFVGGEHAPVLGHQRPHRCVRGRDEGLQCFAAALPHGGRRRAHPRDRHREQVDPERLEAGAIEQCGQLRANRRIGRVVAGLCERGEQPRPDLGTPAVPRGWSCTQYRAALSGSTTTTRPPGFVTRANSPSTPLTSEECWRTATQKVESNASAANGRAPASAAATFRRILCDVPAWCVCFARSSLRSIAKSDTCEICSRPRLSSAVPSPHPTSRMRVPGRGRSVSRRNSEKSESHQRSRKCLRVGEVRASTCRGIWVQVAPRNGAARNYTWAAGRASGQTRPAACSL